MQRVRQNELLDHDAGTLRELTESLEDLRLINRCFGGISTSRALLQEAIAEAQLRNARVLDVAAGDGASLHRAVLDLTSKGFSFRVVALDRAESHLRETDGMRVAAEASALPFRDNSFDFVHTALFLHHLSDDEALSFLREAMRVARYAVLINDLIRSPIHLALVYAGFPLFRSRITRHDSVASVRQAYTRDEVAHLIEQLRPRRWHIRRRYLYRMAVTIWK